MPSASKRFQPYEGKDGDYTRLLDFALAAAKHLDPQFNPPKVLLSKDESEDMQDVMHFNKRWGNETQGFETFHTVELEPRASGQAVDRVQLRTFGMAHKASIEMEVTRSWHDPRFAEIKVSGPQEGVQKVIIDFVTHFGATKLDPSQIKKKLVSAQVSFKVGAWDAAIMKADSVLEVDEAQALAHFVKGAALRAKGDLQGARRHLSRAYQLDPKHQLTLSNYANLFEELSQSDKALTLYQKILDAPRDSSLRAEFYEAIERAIEAIRKTPSD